jgi:predicted transport protein
VSDIKLFSVNSGKANEIFGAASDLEKPLQTLIEKNLETLLGIRFIATEHQTEKSYAGRIDTLGLDENNCPVILEYKRSTNENVINQGLFYLNWLMDHQGDFKYLVLKKFGEIQADAVDWSAPRLICIAADFTKFDEQAIHQMNRNIELIRYRKFGDDLLLLELVNTASEAPKPKTKTPRVKNKGVKDAAPSKDKTVTEWLEDVPKPVLELFESLEGFVFSLGDDIQRKDLELYIAFKRIKNFLTVQFKKDRLLLHLKLNPKQFEMIEGFTRDVTDIGHWGTGDLEVIVLNAAALDRAKALIQQAYEGGSRAS